MLNKLKINNNNMSKVIRRSEAIEACIAFHGVTTSNLQPVLTGIIDTLTSKFKAKYLSKNLLESKTSLVNNLEDSIT